MRKKTYLMLLLAALRLSAADTDTMKEIRRYMMAIDSTTECCSPIEDNNNFKSLVRLCQDNHDFIIASWDELMKDKGGAEKQNLLLAAIFYGCNNACYTDFLIKIFQSPLSAEVKLSALKYNLRYIALNYKSSKVSILLKQALALSRDDEQKKYYKQILTGEMLFADIKILMEGMWNHLKGDERGKRISLKEYLPEQYTWLSQDKNLELIYIALYYPELLLLVQSADNIYYIDKQNIDYRNLSQKDVHDFITSAMGHTPRSFHEKAKQFHLFLKLSMFANDELEKTCNAGWISAEERSVIQDLLIKTQWKSMKPHNNQNRQ